MEEEINLKLKEINKHPRDERIFFDEEPHIYYIDGNAYDISVTGFVHSFFQHFNPDAIVERSFDKWQSDPNNKYYGMTKEEIKNSWIENGKLQSELGTKMHFDIELFYNDVNVSNNSREFAYFLRYFDKHPHLKAYRTEWEVFDERLKLAGSIDMCYQDEKDGKFVLCDWKRSKEIKLGNDWQSGQIPLDHLDDCNFTHYSLQLNVYKQILKLNYGIEVKEMFLVRLHPNAVNYEKILVPDMSYEVSLLFNERIKQLKQLSNNV